MIVRLWLATLTRGHQDADNIRSTKDDAEKVRWRNLLTWTIARHAISEELVLYPAMESLLGDEGVKLSKTDKEQHQGVSCPAISRCPSILT
jgi:hemerythrin-like domain-containing protein